MKAERLRRALGGLLLIGVLGLGQGAAGAEGGGSSPAARAADRASTSTDAGLTVTIHEPQRHTLVMAGRDVSVTGTVTAAPVPVNYIYVIDISQGTSLFGGSCGNPNGDSASDTILDCEIAGLIALNGANLGDEADVSLVAFDSLDSSNSSDSGATVLDLNPVDPGVQTTTEPDNDADGNGTPDVVDALRTLETAGEPADYNQALIAVQSLLVEGETNLVFFVSDGQNEGDAELLTGPGSPLQFLVDAGVTIFTFAIDPAESAPCATGEPLSTIAVDTDGVCAEVARPEAMAVPFGPALAVDRVEIEVGGEVAVATLDSSGQFSHAVSAGLLRLGRNDIIVRAYGVDGAVAEDRTFVVVKGPAPK